ncbi:MAG: T9SS type A sorting domain-containing protein [Candidatus Delongbacteria bacterium]|nr:T9SS type A sorting domain-containing protein [Candidatus Delongbacteria bacterium]
MKKMIQFIVILFFISTALFGLAWEQIFPEIDFSIKEIKTGNVENLSYYDYFFVSQDSGLVYYKNSELFCYNGGILPIVSADCTDSLSDEIVCALGSGTFSDGIYVHSTGSGGFGLAEWDFSPNFVKKLPSGVYVGSDDGLIVSQDGWNWNSLSDFSGLNIKNIAETGDGKLFVSAYGGELLMKNGAIVDTIASTFPDINDVYVRSYPNNNEVLVTLGTGTYSDGLYKVLYNDSTIIGFDRIDWIFEANLVTEYDDSYIVTCKNSADIYIIPFDTGIARQHDHGLDISNIYCISDQYPIYTPNFMIGTDKGVFMCTGTTGINNEQLIINNYQLDQNYPNPFNNETMIPFKLDTGSEVSINIFNSNGEQVKQISLGKMNKGTHEYKLSTDNFTSGQYFYSLSINGEVSGRKKMLYLR